MNLKALRQQYKYTQADLAKLCDTTVRRVRVWENGYQKPSIKYQIKLAKAFSRNLVTLQQEQNWELTPDLSPVVDYQLSDQDIFDLTTQHVKRAAISSLVGSREATLTELIPLLIVRSKGHINRVHYWMNQYCLETGLTKQAAANTYFEFVHNESEKGL